MAKKYPHKKVDNLSVKEQITATDSAGFRHASPERVREAVAYVIKVHGAALEKLAK